MARIAIVDDDVEFANNTAAVLRKGGHEVTTLCAIDEAVPAMVKNKPDLAILDVMFPDNPAAGFDLARRIRRTREIKDIPILVLTGVNQEFPMDFSSKDLDPDWLPVQDFMEKPVDAALLLKKIAALLKARG
jgi:two-component system, OmpR family, alkaline phosphatase synthesis response regulator PhoP